jgi:putative transposase
MRIEPFAVGDIIHVYNRGNRKMDIVRDESDRYRFLISLRYLNDEHPSELVMRAICGEKKYRDNSRRSDLRELGWPEGASPQKPLVEIVAYCLMPNHFHILMREIVAGGITSFMRKLGTSFTSYTNVKYGESGRIFQGAYQARLISDYSYLQYVDVYIQVLNPFELLPPDMPLMNFNGAFNCALDYRFGSLGESLGRINLGILDRGPVAQKFNLPDTFGDYKKIAREAVFDQGIKKFLGEHTFDN